MNETTTKPPFHEIGRLIASLRKERKMKQTELARLSGIQGSYVSQIEAGSRMPSYEVFGRICAALNVSHNAIYRMLFVDSILETNNDDRREVLILLRTLLDKVIQLQTTN